MKHSRFIIILTAIILFFTARTDAALSLEARAAIEEMRARVSQSLQIEDNESTDGQYVPGRELQSVLTRYRTSVYGKPDATDDSLAHWRVSVPQSEQFPADYQPGAMLEKALTNYRTQKTVFTLVKVMKAKEAAENDVKGSEEPVSAPENDHPNDRKAQLPETSHSNSESMTVSSSELLTQSKAALESSVESASKSSGGYAKPSATSANTETSLESASEKGSDQTEVQKYEFKMPRNYRIIVK
ncbi:MAG: hypothetical protein GX569_03390 [Candidatus Riflebacteria bacterium]|nr:hypothetical protein [Candidatus Riflebacteria bacterium]